MPMLLFKQVPHFENYWPEVQPLDKEGIVLLTL